MKTVTFKEALELMFEKHPDVKNEIPFATSFLNHRAQVDWFDKEFAQLIEMILAKALFSNTGIKQATSSIVNNLFSWAPLRAYLPYRMKINKAGKKLY